MNESDQTPQQAAKDIRKVKRLIVAATAVAWLHGLYTGWMGCIVWEYFV